MIDLHLHLDGSLPIKTVLHLARVQKIILPSDDEKILKSYLSVSREAKSLNDYLKCFDLPLSLLQNGSAVECAVFELLRELSGQGIIYSEIRFAPQLHTKKGCIQEEIINSAIKGLESAENEFNIIAKLILCTMRGGSFEDNALTVRLAAEFLQNGVCAVDLAGAEAIYKTELYRDIFLLAQKLSVPFTIHAGEADGAESVRSAVNFGARRIGHGVAAINDKALMDEIKSKSISIECCLTSNLQTKAVQSLSEHPLKKFIDFGILATVNTDNMTVSDTTIKNELALAHEIAPEISAGKLIMNAADSAFLSEKERTELKLRLAAVMPLNS